MADCRFTLLIDGINIPFTENEFKAYLAKGGAKAFVDTRPQILSDKNRDRMDAAIESIVNGELTERQIIKFIDDQKLSQKVKNDLKEYLSQGINSKKKSGKLGNLTEAQQQVYSLVNNRYLNGDISYEQAMDEFDFFIERQESDVAKGIIEEVKNAFFNSAKKQHDADVKRQVKSEEVEFKNEVGSMQFGINEGVLTTLMSDERLIAGGAAFQDESSFLLDNDQIVAAFLFDQYANDLNRLINAFQRQYGEKYLDEMEKYVQAWDGKETNPPMSVISTSIALHNHLTELIDKEDFTYASGAKLRIMKERNERTSQGLARWTGLALNAFRAWRKDLIKDLAWVGIVTPQIKDEANRIKAAILYDISDEDLIAYAEGDYSIFDNNDIEQDEKPVEKKKPNAIKKYRASKQAKKMNVRSKSDLQKEIKEQIKKCK